MWKILRFDRSRCVRCKYFTIWLFFSTSVGSFTKKGYVHYLTIEEKHHIIITIIIAAFSHGIIFKFCVLLHRRTSGNLYLHLQKRSNVLHSDLVALFLLLYLYSWLIQFRLWSIKPKPNPMSVRWIIYRRFDLRVVRRRGESQRVRNINNNDLILISRVTSNNYWRWRHARNTQHAFVKTVRIHKCIASVVKLFLI